jgi:bifunctional DNA-binding transcriptional regulator/antitoxin component of YhaV-PrlF toxin-antitoxin module
MGFLMKVELEDVKCITETALTIRGSRRRMTVPSEVVEILELKNGDRLRWVVFKDGTIQINKVEK